jgi:O-glycosyl hydrolase
MAKLLPADGSGARMLNGRGRGRCAGGRRGRQGRPGLEALEVRSLLSAAVVNWGDVKQTIDGFGASSAWAGGTIPSAALQAAFSTTTGAGLSLLRTRIAPNGGTSENLMAQQVGAMGAKAWSTPWTPPREWKTNHDTANGGSLDPSHYQDYANHLANYVQDMWRQGVPLYAVSIQNEPNWTADYESCRWTAQQFADFLPYVGQTFAARGITTKIMMPESLNWDFSLANIVMANATLSQYVGILAAHNYGETATSWKPVTIANGKQVWETEISSFASGTEMDTAIDTADDIFQAMTLGQANAYHYWWLNSSGVSAVMVNWNATKRLWAMGQYSRFVRPGWVRIGSTDDGGGLDITTFKDPVSGKFAIVVVNKNTTGSVNETFTLNGVTALNVTPYATSATESMAQYGAINLVGASFTATIPARTIMTFVGQDATAAALILPVNLRATPVQGNTWSQMALSWTDESSGETAYTVERSTNGTTWTVLTTGLAANSWQYTDTGLAENTTYYYRVKPTNGDATTYSAVTSAATVLRAASGLNGTRTGTGLNLTWTINSGVSTGVSIDRSLDGVVWTNIANVASRATSYADTIPGYSANQIYFYRVRNTAGAVSSAYTQWSSGLSVPTNFTVTGTTMSSVTLAWTNATTGASGAWIEQNINGGWTRVSVNNLLATAGTYTVTGLTGGTTYSFRMRVSSGADSVYSGYTGTVSATTVAPRVPPIVWYTADETTGNVLADASGNGKTGAITGTHTFGAGIVGNALNLSGGYAQAPTGVVSALGDFTISTWVKLTTVDNWSRIWDFGTGTGNYMFLTPKAGDSGLPRFAITSGSGEQRVYCSVAITAGVWTNLVFTETAGTGTLYINGAVAGSGTLSLTPSSLGNTTQNYIGKSQFSADPTVKGGVDDFRIYERALSAGEVQAIYNLNGTPTVVSAAAASPNVVTGTTTALSVLGADDGGEANLTYKWSATGPAAVSFTANGTNAAMNTTATLSAAGNYVFTVTISDAYNEQRTSSVAVTVSQVFTGIGPANPTMLAGTIQQMYAADQFGKPMDVGTVTWSATGGMIGADGRFTAPLTAGAVMVNGDIGGTQWSTNVTVAAPWAWYKLDDAGALVTDSSGHGYNGSLAGTTSSGAGTIGNAVTLAGGYATLPTGVVSSLNDFTISAWVRLTSKDSWARLFDFGTGTNVNMFLAPVDGNGVVRYAITTGGAGVEQRVVSSTALDVGTWYFIAVTQAGNAATLYINGAVAGTATITLKPSGLGSTTQNYLGDSQYVADPTLKATIDDFRIYGAAAPAGAIAALYAAGPAVAGSAPSGVSATSMVGNRVDVSWTDNTSAEVGYLLERATDAGFTTGVTRWLLPAGTAGYADTGVAGGTTYYYRVAAVLVGGSSAGAVAAGAVVARVMGDANGDGKVDAFDLNMVATNWQTVNAGASTIGDFNGVGKVDAFDLNLLALNWQAGVTTQVTTAQTAEVFVTATTVTTADVVTTPASSGTDNASGKNTGAGKSALSVARAVPPAHWKDRLKGWLRRGNLRGGD